MSNANQRKVAPQPAAGYYQVEKFDPSQYVTISGPPNTHYQLQQPKPCCEEKIIVQPQRLMLPAASFASEKSKQILLQQVQMQPQIFVQQQQQQRQIVQQQPPQQQQQQQAAPQAKSRNRKKKGKKTKKVLQAQQDAVTGRDILVAIEVTDESGSDASTSSILEESHHHEVLSDMFINNQLPRQEIVMSSQMSFEGFTPNKPAPFSIESLSLPAPNANCYHEPPAPKGETKYVMIKEAPVFKTINQNFFSTNTSVKENIIHYNHVKDVIITLNRNHWHTQRIVVKDTNYHHYLINNVIKIKDIHHQKIETTNGESRNISDYKQVNRIEQPVCQQTVDEIVKAANYEINKSEVVMQQQQQPAAPSYVQQENNSNANVEYHYSPLQPCGGCPESMLQQQQ